MMIGKKSSLATSALLLVAVLVTSVALGPASAGGIQKVYKGPAVGTVTCTSMVGKLRTSDDKIKVALSNCIVSNLPVGVTETITSGKLTGAFHGSWPCFGSASTTPFGFSVKWKGTYQSSLDPTGHAVFLNSTASAKGFNSHSDLLGNSGVEVPNSSTEPSGGTVTGSFPGTEIDESFFYSQKNAAAIASECGPPVHLHALTIDHGTVVIP